MPSTLVAAPSTLGDSAYVAYKLGRPSSGVYAAIDLPADGVVAMLDKLMRRVQAGIRPTVTWTVRDCAFYRAITMRWMNAHAQLQLEAHTGIGSRGFNLSLYPYFYGLGDDHTKRSTLAHWSVSRSTWPRDYGQLGVCRSEHTTASPAGYAVTDLRFDDPVLDGIPRCKPVNRYGRWTPFPELGDDIIAVTQGWLEAAGISS